MTLQNAPPGLDYDRDKRFSKVVFLLAAIPWATGLQSHVINNGQVFRLWTFCLSQFHIKCKTSATPDSLEIFTGPYLQFCLWHKGFTCSAADFLLIRHFTDYFPCLQSFKEMIAMCLVKDPAKRPTAEKLLRHSFFKHARTPDYIARHVLDGLPPLWERVKALKVGQI